MEPIIKLPDHFFEFEWIDFVDTKEEWRGKINKEAKRLVISSGWNPKLVKLEGDSHMVDLTLDSDFEHVKSIKVIQFVDHPILSKLPANTPKATKSIFKKEVRLKHVRATEYWTISNDLEKAEDAWDEFIYNRILGQ